MENIGVFIPIIALMIPIVAIWTKHQQKLAEMNVQTTAQATAEKAAQYASQVHDLEDRVRVPTRATTWPHRSKRCATSATLRNMAAACRWASNRENRRYELGRT